MKKFFHNISPDRADTFTRTLTTAGYPRTEEAGQADFFLIDKEPTSIGQREKFFQMVDSRPIFIIPHTPYAYWLWDRWLEPMPVACNFVTASGARMGMLAYGYPCRVEVCGFARCPVRPFERREGRNLLYMPPRNLFWKTKDLNAPNDFDLHIATLRWIIKWRNSFDHIRINYTNSGRLHIFRASTNACCTAKSYI